MERYKVINYNFTYTSIENNQSITRDLNSLDNFDKESIIQYCEVFKKSIAVLSFPQLTDFIDRIDEICNRHQVEAFNSTYHLNTSYHIVHRYLNHTEIEINIDFIKFDIYS